ncbi:uncharacterized protein ISCGN_023411 [Ixodes scapularis]
MKVLITRVSHGKKCITESARQETMDVDTLATTSAKKLTNQEERYVVVFRAQERYDLTSIPTSTLQRNFYTALNIKQAQCTREELPTFRTSKVTNTISAIVRDRLQAQTLLKIRSLKASDKAVTVIAHEIPPENTCRGVAHGVDPKETAGELHEALHCRTQEILYARPLGSRGLALVTFQGKRPPRTILYHGFITKHKKEVKELLASQHNTVVYVDGATKGKEYAAGAVFYRGEGATPFEIATSCGLGTEVTSDTVEEAALLFTLGVYGHLPGKTRNLIIYTDSKEAVRNMYKLKATTSPTVHAFFDTALSLYREHGTRISVRWVPGHQEISGNDMAHAAAQCGMRIPQLPSQQASNCEESVEQPENTACYDPVEELRRCRKMRKIQLAEKWQPEDYPLPAKTFKRKETVQLRRIRTEGAVTPRLKYHINLSQLRRTQPYAVPPDPRCQRCKDPEAIPRLDHLLWECQALALCRVEAIETLPEEQRPKKLVDWTHPQGEAQRRTRILQSLLDFVAKSDLGDSI